MAGRTARSQNRNIASEIEQHATFNSVQLPRLTSKRNKVQGNERVLAEIGFRKGKFRVEGRDSAELAETRSNQVQNADSI